MLEYRRGPFGYTPVDFELANRSIVAGDGPFTGVTMEMKRGDVLARRAICRISRTEQARDEAGRQLRERLRQPARPAPTETAEAGALTSLMQSGASTLRLVGRAVGLLPAELNAAVVGAGCDFWVWTPELGWRCGYELEGVTGTGEDPCDDDYGYYDDFTDSCQCWSGDDWGDPNTGDFPCQDDGGSIGGESGDDGPDGSGSGGSGTSSDNDDPTENCDPDLDPDDGGCAEEPCDPDLEECEDPCELDPLAEGCGCGDDRDVMAQEYEDHSVTLRPDCEDFASSGGSANFSWTELNDGWSNGNPHRPYGLVSSSLTSGLESTRTNYDRGGILLTSGYRCPHGNSNVGGVSQSFHMHGRAADMYSLSHSWTEEEFNLLRTAAQNTGPVELLNWDTYADRHLHAAW